MKLTCYMNMPSHYQEDFYQALATRCDLLVVYSGELSTDRSKLGWESMLQGYRHRFSSSMSLREKVFLDKTSAHFLAGFPGGALNIARAMMSADGVRMAVQTELPVPRRFTRAWQRVGKSYASMLRRKDAILFGIGEPARRFFAETGFPEDRIFPFGYFSQSRVSAAGDYTGPIIYVGQLVPRKGVDLLLRAFTQSQVHEQKKLVIVGDGDQRSQLEDLTKELKIQEQVDFLGSKSLNEVHAAIAASSCLVLPSLYDGWGVVVNEALQLGVPVVVSKGCGASELVQHGSCGVIVSTGSVQDLSRGLDAVCLNETSWKEYADRAVKYSACLSPLHAADFLCSVLRYQQSEFRIERPEAPWLRRGPVT